METLYLIIIIVLFLLAISDLIVGVSNDAVNFLNSAVGSKATTYKIILGVAAIGIIVGSTFSGGMMEVARKGIFNPEHFYFSELMILFLAVMVADVILLDAFNTFGMPTSTTVSIVFELLGAAVALSVIKIYANPEALGIGSYINSAKALAIISGILLSVVIAFSAGGIMQYITRLIFSFDYDKRLKYLGSIWGGISIAAITYFLLVKGSKGASFMDEELQQTISNNTFLIIAGSFVFWTIILQLLLWLTRIDILKLIVLVGTFALAMAFAGNDLVNFIGVPLAGYNSYEIWLSSNSSDPQLLSMEGLAGAVKTPTFLLIIAGIIMTVTLWTSKKARSVVRTELDLGRQFEGNERFASYAVSRSLVRNFNKIAASVNNVLPKGIKNSVGQQFDQQPFVSKQAKMGADAPSFDMLRASVILVVASILITIGTNLKLPLSTTYVTFMVAMGASLADGAWSRESAVYRVSGVISVVGGWFFTALAAFTAAFVFAMLFYFGGPVAIIIVIILASIIVYRTHRYHSERMAEQIAFEKSLDEGTITNELIIELSISNMTKILNGLKKVLGNTIRKLEDEDLTGLNKTYQEFKDIQRKAEKIQRKASKYLEKIADDQIESIHLYMLVSDYLYEMTSHARNIVKNSLDHIDNNHKPLLPTQIKELTLIQQIFDQRIDATIEVFKSSETVEAKRLMDDFHVFVKAIRTARKNQIKRIKNHETGTRNSVLFLSHIGEYRNLAIFSNRLVKVLDELILDPEEEEVLSKVD